MSSNLNNYPSNPNFQGMISTAPQNFPQNHNYGNMNNYHYGNSYQNQFDGYSQNFPVAPYMGNMNSQRKNTPFDFQQ